MENNKDVEWMYFLSNEEWYTFDYDKGEYILTDKATPKAKESYKNYLKYKNTTIDGKYIV